MKKTILVTGGTGFIGSHTTVELQNAGYNVVIIDNLSNSKADVVDGIEKITGIRLHWKVSSKNILRLLVLFTSLRQRL